MSRSVFHTPKGWADKDETTLERMAKRPIGIIANALGRTEHAVRNKVHELRVSMNPPERSPYGRPKK